jgi:hypothetical protein
MHPIATILLMPAICLHPPPWYPQVGELGNIGWREEENLRKQALEAAGITTATGPLPPAKDQAAAAAAAAAAVSVTKKV